MGNLIERLVFQPPVKSNYRLQPDLIWLSTDFGRVPAYYIDRKAPLSIIYSHSNAEDIGIKFVSLKRMSYEWNVNIFLFEYPGYGLSDGKPSEVGVYQSIEAAYMHLTEVLGVPADRIVAFGRSLGTAACCYLGSKHELKGMILQSPLLSIFRIPFPFSFTVPGDCFCSVEMIPEVECPVFIIHGLEDEIVPPYHAMDLYKKCKNPVMPLWVEGGAHNDLECLADFDFSGHVARFFRYLENVD